MRLSDVPKPFLVTLLVIFAAEMLPSGTLAQDNRELADRARDVIQKHCAACHGGSQVRPASGYNLVDAATFRERSQRENILEWVKDGLMPPTSHEAVHEKKYGVTAARLQDMQLANAARTTLTEWLEAGAPAWVGGVEKRPFLSHDQLIDVVLADLQSLPAADRRYQRYLTLVNLYNAGDTSQNLVIYHEAVQKLLNSLSWHTQIQRFPIVKESKGTLIRLDLRRLGYCWGTSPQPWTASTWEKIASYYPYSIPLRGRAAAEVVDAVGTKRFLLRADWFAFAASQPPLYHELLSLPDSLDGLASMLKIDIESNIARYSVHRAGTTNSGVSTNHRIIERHALTSDQGAFWLSYDFRSAAVEERANILKFPLGPDSSPQSFRHAGGEVIFNLPNGLQAYGLYTAEGKRLDVAPTDIVQNQSRGDAAVINGISCMQCHREGMRDIDDHLRPFVETTVQPEVWNRFQRLYPGRDVIDPLIQQDRARFLAALEQCRVEVRAFAPTLNGGDGETQDEPVAKLVSRFEQRIDLVNAAAELNVSEEDLVSLFRILRTNARMLEMKARLDFTRISRSDFDLEFGELAIQQFGGDYPKQFPFIPLPRNENTGGGGNGGSGVKPPVLDFRASSLSDRDAQAAQLAWAKFIGLEKPIGANSVAMNMVLIPPGKFTMGSPKTETDRGSNEGPVSVELTQPFLIGQTEVTQGQWTTVMGANSKPWTGKEYVKEGASYPAVYVSHGLGADGVVEKDSATEFCRKLTARERAAGRLPSGWEYRLPTEAEWEYACRAGKTSRYSFGDDATRLGDFAWFVENALNKDEKYAHTVATKLANPWNLYDMHGNVWEWCEDWYTSELPGGANPRGPEKASDRVDRGGSWYYTARSCRSAERYGDSPVLRNSILGFRLAAVQSGK